MAEVTNVQALRDHWLRLWFDDGYIVELDMGPVLARGGVFAPIYEHRAIFEQVRVDYGTIVWPGEVDLCPDVLRGRFEADPPLAGERRVIRPAGATA
jgi:hypothetical protein